MERRAMLQYGHHEPRYHTRTTAALSRSMSDRATEEPVALGRTKVGATAPTGSGEGV